MAHAKQTEASDEQAANVTSSPSSIPNLNLTRAAAEFYAEKVRNDPEIQVNKGDVTFRIRRM